MLADGHAMIRRTMRALLDGEPDIVVSAEASDVSALVPHVQRHGRALNVLVLDLPVPNESTIEMIRRLRAQAAHTEVVVLTMAESAQLAQQALSAGAIGSVLKDHADSDLATAIRLAARGEEYVSPRLSAALDAFQRGAGIAALSAREVESHSTRARSRSFH
jgi:DNA-binding NarL/FixJ family response regulator